MLDAGEKIVWDEDGGQNRQTGGPGGPAGRHRPAVPRPDERGILRRSPAALRHRLLPRRRTCLLRPTGNLRPAEPVAGDQQPVRRGEPGRRAPQPDVRPAGRNAVVAFAGRADWRRDCSTRELPEELDDQQRQQAEYAAATLGAVAGWQGPSARGPVDPRRRWIGPATTPCCWPSFSASGSWPTCTS